MPIKLRDYQVEIEENLRSFFRENPTGNVILDGRTGTGKTVSIISMAKQAMEKGNKVLIMSNRTELMRQAGGAFEKQEINPAYINPSVKKVDKNWMATSAMMQTIQRRIDDPEMIEFLKTRDFIFMDEVHESHGDFLIQSGIVDHIPIVGATATAIRQGGQTQLGMLWDDISKGREVKYFVERGWLVPDRYFGVDCGDVSNVPYDSKSGDYQGYGMYKHFDKREKYAGVIDNYRTHADGTKSLTFCANQHHAVKTAVAFDKAGVETRFLVSGQSKPEKPDSWKNEGDRIRYEQKLELYMLLEQYKHLTGNRKDLLKDLESGKITNLVNVSMLTTGVDIPSLETVIIDRYTLSLSLYLQILGRGSRPSPETGKIHFTVLDLGNHAGRKENNLGRYMDVHQFGLWHHQSKGGGVAGTKLCDPNKKDKSGKRGCNRLIHISMQFCPFCGFRFLTEKEEKEVELQEIAYQGMPEEDVLIRNMNYEQLKAYRELKKYKMGWIGRVLYQRGSSEAISAAIKNNADLTDQEKNYISRKAGEDEVYKGMKAMGYKHYYIRERILKYLK